MANPFVHVELSSTDLDASKAFYGKLFDWKLEDMPMGPEASYTMIQVGDGTGGGMMKQMIPGAPSSWLAYVLVDDIEAATRKAQALGAKVMKDVTEVPDMGWFSVIVDPTGAALGLCLVGNFQFLAFPFDELGVEGDGRILALQRRGDAPVLLRDEALDLPLPLTDDPNGNRLDPPCTEPPPDFLPQKGTDLIAH